MRNQSTFGIYLGITVVMLAILILGTIGCARIPREGRAARAAENVGVENPVVIKRSIAWGALGGCHEDDVTKFTVRGSNRTVEVCAPVIGGYTVRS